MDTESDIDVDTGLPSLSLDVNSSAAPLVADGHYFRDSRGGAVLLRGINVAGDSKVPPFTAVTSASQLEVLPTLGFNTLRLLFIWEAFEPVPGEYNTEYVAYFTQVVEWANTLGLYVVADFHQDAYSRYLLNGCGEGFPGWAISPDVELATPDNGEKCTSWGIDMISDDTLAAVWSDFHNDTYGAQSAYLDMVATVTEALLPYDNIIGYDLINEPWGTDAELMRLFEQISQRIRNVDPDATLFIPTHALVSGGVRADAVPMPDLSNVAYAPHYYDGMVLLMERWSGADPSPSLDKLYGKAKEQEVPMFLGEFGAPAGTEDGQGYIGAQLDWLDRRWVSSAQWNYTPGWREDVKDGWNMEDLSIVNGEGTLRDNFVSRPSPQRIGGAPIQFALDDDGFTMKWENRTDYGETVVYLPAGYADNRTLALEFTGAANGECDISDHTLLCNVEGAGEVRLSLRSP